MGADPAGEVLARRRLGEHVVREPQNGDEDLGGSRHLSCSGIVDGNRRSGVVEEEPVPGGIGVPEGRLQPFGIGGIVKTEAGVGIPPLPGGDPVLLPEEQEGHPLVALKFPVNLSPVRFDPGRRRGSFLLLQSLGQKRLAARFGQGPGNRLKLLEVLRDGGG